MAQGYGKVDVKAMRAEKGAARGRYLDNEYPVTEGKHLLRFLPPKSDGPIYFMFYGHYLPDRSYEVCPKMTWQESCPICILGDNLFRSKDPDEIAQGRGLYRKPSYIANVIDVRNPAEGVKLLRFGTQVRDQIVGLYADPEDPDDQGIDITDPKNGATIRLTKTPPDQGGFPKYVVAQGKQGPIPYANWLKELHDLKAVVRGMTKSKDELRRIVSESILLEDAPGTETRSNRRPAVDEDEDFAEESMAKHSKANGRAAAADEEDEEEIAPKPAKKLAAKAPPPVDPDEDDEPVVQPKGRRVFPEEEDE